MVSECNIKIFQYWLRGPTIRYGSYIWISRKYYIHGSQPLVEFCSLSFYFCRVNKKEGSEKFKIYWIIIGFIFFVLSIDEMISFHERASGMLRNAFPTSGIFEFALVIPAIFIISFLGLFF